MSIANRIASVADGVLRIGGTRLHHYIVQALYSRLRGDYVRDDLKIEMFTPSYVQPDISDRPMVERIYAAFQKAKYDQKSKDAVFMPSTLWQKVLDSCYMKYPDVTIDQFHFFLSNFGAQEKHIGITWTHLLSQYAKTLKSRKYFERMIIGQKIGWWLKFESNGRDLSVLSHPRHGNLWGAIVNDSFVSYESVLNEFYGRMISNFVKKDRPVVGEVGAGYGVLFYFIARAFSEFCYLDFDLPETLCCATYYLMKSFPQERFLLYGEGKLNEDAIKEYDFILMPSYVIKDLPNDSIDIFVNMSSLGEMKSETCRVFIREICRTAQAFWHMNHECDRQDRQEVDASLLNSEYPVLEYNFDLVIRYIDALNAVWKGTFDKDYDIYGYYYKRRPI